MEKICKNCKSYLPFNKNPRGLCNMSVEGRMDDRDNKLIVGDHYDYEIGENFGCIHWAKKK